MNISQGIVLNLSAGGIPPRLHMVQGDSNTRTIEASLWGGAQPYAVPDGASVMVRFRKPDGTGGLYDTTEGGSPITFDGNNVTAPVAAQMLAVPGEVAAEMDIYGAGTGAAAEKLATFRFIVEVAPCVLPDAEIISSDYYNIIAEQIAKAIIAGEKADAAIAASDRATAAATAAEQSKVAAAGSASSASRDAQTAASAKADAVAAKTAAESAQGAAQASQTAAAASASGAEEHAQGAAQDAQNAAQDAEDAEAWAVGKRNGVDVPSSDPAYHNNAKYYKDQAQGIAGGGVTSFNGRSGSVEPQSGDYTKGMVGLGNVDNTSDADKPISTATQAALDAKQPALTAGQNIAISGNTIGTKAFPCNPNLLDNWYFGNPVNQRGQTEYTGNGYCIDRWKMQSHPVSVQSDGIKITCSSAASYSYALQQLLENLKEGMQYTISALITENTTTTGFGFRVGSKASSAFLGTGLFSWTATADSTAGTQGFGVQFNSRADDNGKYIKIKAIKLELGDTQTLAHQDASGNWVLNEIPGYGEQLLRCQRYCTTINSWTRVRMSYYNSNNLYFMVPTPCSMRATPSLSDPSGSLVVSGLVSGTDQAGFNFSVSSLLSGAVLIVANKTTHGLTDGQLVKRGGSDYTAVLLSADL